MSSPGPRTDDDTLSDALNRRLALPVMAAPMFTVSDPDLVVAQCMAGIIGSFPALNARPASALHDWLSEIEGRLAEAAAASPTAPIGPVAVNQIVHRTNARLEKDLATCASHRVPIIITSLGARTEVYDAVHSYGGVVLHDVINDQFARKAIEKGADGLIAVAAGAGGHGGTTSPFALVQEIRSWYDGPLVLSGAIAHGASVLAAQAAGADLAYIGSAMLTTAESRASDSYKDMVVGSSAADVVYTNFFTGVHGNYLRGSITAVGLDPDDLPTSDPSAMSFADGEDSPYQAWRDIWGAGQGVGAVTTRPPVAELVRTLRQQYDAAADRLARISGSASDVRG